MSRIRSPARNLLQREPVERELDDDLRAYRQMLIEEKRASGLSEEDAVRQTCLEIGPLQAVKDNVWEAKMGSTLETIWRDVRQIRFTRATAFWARICKRRLVRLQDKPIATIDVIHNPNNGVHNE